MREPARLSAVHQDGGGRAHVSAVEARLLPDDLVVAEREQRELAGTGYSARAIFGSLSLRSGAPPEPNGTSGSPPVPLPPTLMPPPLLGPAPTPGAPPAPGELPPPDRPGFEAPEPRSEGPSGKKSAHHRAAILSELHKPPLRATPRAPSTATP